LSSKDLSKKISIILGLWQLKADFSPKIVMAGFWDKTLDIFLCVCADFRGAFCGSMVAQTLGGLGEELPAKANSQ